ncbi:MAG TPA: chromosome partitioning protein [Acidimicrobiia bacterium]|nr:chromosome partitioning protein [Acidimicrobiia bacterium]
MSLFVVASVKGAPGVTTTTVALGAAWPGDRSVVVVEADASGGDLAARHGLCTEPGLASLATAARRPIEAADVARHIQVLAGGLAVVPAPVTGTHALAALGSPPALARALRSLEESDVLLDCGRIAPGSFDVSLAVDADAIVLLARPSLDDLQHLGDVLRLAGEMDRPCALVLRGRGPYDDREVESTLGVPVLGRVPDDARVAGMFNGRAGRGGTARLGKFLAEVRTVAGGMRRMAFPLPVAVEKEARA